MKFFVVFKKNFEEHKSFLFQSQCDPQIHLWCNTFWMNGAHHGNWAFSVHLLLDHVSKSIGGGLNSRPCLLQYCTENHAHPVRILTTYDIVNQFWLGFTMVVHEK